MAIFLMGVVDKIITVSTGLSILLTGLLMRTNYLMQKLEYPDELGLIPIKH